MLNASCVHARILQPTSKEGRDRRITDASIGGHDFQQIACQQCPNLSLPVSSWPVFGARWWSGRRWHPGENLRFSPGVSLHPANLAQSGHKAPCWEIFLFHCVSQGHACLWTVTMKSSMASVLVQKKIFLILPLPAGVAPAGPGTQRLPEAPVPRKGRKGHREGRAKRRRFARPSKVE